MSLAKREQVVPIFPLPGVQLFPHALLPLHIFEPRYRAMLKDCLAGDRQLVVTPIDDASEPTERGPAVHRVCGLGVVVEHAPLADGRANILLRGVGRVNIVHELPSGAPYRVVRAEPLMDRYDGPLDNNATTLRLLVDQLALRLPSGGETLRELARAHDHPGALCDVLASALVTDPVSRQRLMEQLDVGERVDQLSSEMALILRRLAGEGSRN